MAQIESWFGQDLSNAVKVQYIIGNVFSMDNLGNRVGVYVYKDGAPYALTGTISGNVIRADGGTVAVTGSLNENRAWIDIPQSCYTVPGRISIVIKNTSDSVVTTLCAVVANVYQSSTDTVIDPGTIIPSIEALITEIETAVASIPADYSALWTKLAPAFDASASYAAGQYVTYNSGMYRFKVAHAGSWASGDVIAVNVGGELSGINEALYSVNEKAMALPENATLLPMIFKHGNIDGQGRESNLSYRVLSFDPYTFNKSETYIISSGFRVRLFLYNKSTGAFNSASSWYTGSVTFGTSYSYRVLIARSTEDTSEYADVSTFVRQAYKTNGDIPSVDAQYDVKLKSNALSTLGSSFIHGVVTGSGELQTNVLYRVTSKEKTNIGTYKYIGVNTGFRYRIIRYYKDTGLFHSASDWYTDVQLITPNYLYAFNIARIESDETTTEIADIRLFTKQAFFIEYTEKPVSLKRLGRVIDAFSDAGAERKLYSQSATFYDSKYYICGNKRNQVQTVTVWDNSGVFVNSETYNNLTHANSITAIPNYLIIATATSNIALLDIDSLAFIKFIDVSDYVVTAYSVSNNYGDTVYFIGQSVDNEDYLTVCKLDIENETTEIVCSVLKPGNKTPQGFAMIGNCGYLSFSQSNEIFKFMADSGIIVDYYMLPQGDSIHPAGEYEDLFVKNNLLFINSIPFNNSPQYNALYEKAFCQFFQTSVTDKLPPMNEYADYTQALQANILTVDEDMTYSFNPLKKASTIEEITFVANYLKGAQINIKKCSGGVCSLYDGVYSIVKGEGVAEFSLIEAQNCKLIASNITATELVANVSDVSLIDCEIGTITKTNSIITTQTDNN